MQQHDAVASPILELLTGIELRPGLLVEAVEIADTELGGCLGLADVEKVLDQHAERRAPVADVVLADHRVADELEQAHKRVADHRGAQVPDVHLLGDVRCRVVDDDALGRHCQPDAEPIVVGKHAELLGEERVVEGDVDEARAGDLERCLATPRSRSGNDGVGHLARLAAELLGQGERAVGLSVGPIARTHHRVDHAVGAGNGGKRRCQQLGNDDEGISHGRSIVPVSAFVRHPDSLALRDRQRFVAILAGIPPS